MAFRKSTYSTNILDKTRFMISLIFQIKLAIASSKSWSVLFRNQIAGAEQWYIIKSKTSIKCIKSNIVNASHWLSHKHRTRFSNPIARHYLKLKPRIYSFEIKNQIQHNECSSGDHAILHDNDPEVDLPRDDQEREGAIR